MVAEVRMQRMTPVHHHLAVHPNYDEAQQQQPDEANVVEEHANLSTQGKVAHDDEEVREAARH